MAPSATSANSFPELRPPARVLLGPGPSNVHPRVMKAMLSPVLGHLDPDFVGIMEDIKKLLRLVFRTSNEITFPVSGTGSAGMECVMANLIEDGDEVVVGVNGAFGVRLAEVADRLGAKVHKVEAQWGRIVEPDQVAAALAKIEKPKLVAIVHAETSTGIHQPLEEISKMTRRSGALLAVDAVTSLGCVPLEIDEWGIDACYSCTQKGIGAPPGLAPVTFNARAMDAIHKRTTKCRSWYFDVGLIEQYWGPDRLYHHTAPITMNYAIYEALRIVVEEGLEARFKRHIANAGALVAGLKAMGIELAAQEGHRLPQLTAISIPDGIRDAKVRERLLKLFNIEIGAGLGPFKGKVWRIGLMGEGSRRENVMLVLNALEEILGSMGMEIARGRALSAADKAYESMGLGAGEPR
ncbi:MAG TPA: alanine--glyoxylate aminotransferase family protein [Candidatus Binataceae bacterium]|nr:alanine--glyoxylate aminotransferase family protein [Candidatus Binataceae bacterium]